MFAKNRNTRYTLIKNVCKNILAKVFRLKYCGFRLQNLTFHSFFTVIVTTHLFSIYFNLEKLIYTCQIGTEGQRSKTRDRTLNTIHEKEVRGSEIYVIYTLPLWDPHQLELKSKNSLKNMLFYLCQKSTKSKNFLSLSLAISASHF